MSLTKVNGKVLKTNPNLAAVAKIFDVPYTSISYLSSGLSLTGLSIVVDPSTEYSWFIGASTGNVTSWSTVSDSLRLVTSTGTFDLKRAKAVDIDLLFKTEQHVQYYYDVLQNWDEAIFRAQLNVYLKGYSPRLMLPNGEISITRPILNGVALGDYIHNRYPELNFYNPANGQYKATWPLIMHGVYRKQQDGGIGGYRGTQIVFRGCANRADMTWTQWAIIHSGPNPNEVGQIRKTDPILKQWSSDADLENFNIRAIGQDGIAITNVHGLYFNVGTQVTVRNMSIYQCYGAGVCVDNTWDSIFENLKILQCGRMSPVFGQYLTDGNLTYEYETYAPIHVMRSPLADNSNFIRFHNCHVEDNIHAAVDVIVSGNSSPIWFNDLHVECQAGLGGTSSTTTRHVMGLGNFGVTYFGQDAQPGYVYTARPDTNTGGYVEWNGGAMYAQTYSHIVRMTKYSALVMSNNMFPNSGIIQVNGGNSNPYVVLSNSSVGDCIFNGGNSNLTPLKAVNCKFNSITMDYSYGPNLVNCEVTGDVSLTNTFTTNNLGICQFENCTLGSLNGTLQYASGTVNLTSSTVPSNFIVHAGHIDITRYQYYITTNLGG